MKVQQLHPGDRIAAQLPALARRAFDTTYRPHNPNELIDEYLLDSLSDAAVTKDLANPLNTFLIAVEDNAITGYLKMRPSKGPKTISIDDSVEIERIYAAPDYTGRGVGAELMKAAITHAHNANFKTIWLGVWAENQRAVKFYEREGFTAIGEHVFMMKDDPQRDFVMSLNLGDG